MADQQLSDRVRELIEGRIDSLIELEALLLLARDAQRRWAPLETSRELGIAPERAQTALERLCINGLLGVKLGEDVLYWFEPASKELVDAVQLLERELRQRRLAVLSHFEERVPSHLRDFADAFRLGKGKKKNG